jgi:hypothetical protein
MNGIEKDAKSWGFPFTPYKIQEDFMKSLYDCIEDKKIGMFESPTGTVNLYPCAEPRPDFNDS